jgi:hypothetical protein
VKKVDEFVKKILEQTEQGEIIWEPTNGVSVLLAKGYFDGAEVRLSTGIAGPGLRFLTALDYRGKKVRQAIESMVDEETQEALEKIWRMGVKKIMESLETPETQPTTSGLMIDDC